VVSQKIIEDEEDKITQMLLDFARITGYKKVRLDTTDEQNKPLSSISGSASILMSGTTTVPVLCWKDALKGITCWGTSAC